MADLMGILPLFSHFCFTRCAPLSIRTLNFVAGLYSHLPSLPFEEHPRFQGSPLSMAGNFIPTLLSFLKIHSISQFGLNPLHGTVIKFCILRSHFEFPHRVPRSHMHTPPSTLYTGAWLAFCLFRPTKALSQCTGLLPM